MCIARSRDPGQLLWCHSVRENGCWRRATHAWQCVPCLGSRCASSIQKHDRRALVVCRMQKWCMCTSRTYSSNHSMTVRILEREQNSHYQHTHTTELHFTSRSLLLSPFACGANGPNAMSRNVCTSVAARLAMARMSTCTGTQTTTCVKYSIRYRGPVTPGRAGKRSHALACQTGMAWCKEAARGASSAGSGGRCRSACKRPSC